MPGAPQQIKLLRWMMFAVLLSIVPLLGALITSIASNHFEGMYHFLSGGELLLIATTLAAASVGELFGSRPQSGSQPQSASRTEVIAGGAAMLVVVLGALSYPSFRAIQSSGQTANEPFVAWFSGALFILSMASGAICVALSER
jgi:hypothetical protein